jgi:hypothetical protein
MQEKKKKPNPKWVNQIGYHVYISTYADLITASVVFELFMLPASEGRIFPPNRGSRMRAGNTRQYVELARC